MLERISLVELENRGILQLGRGKIISKKDMKAMPGKFPVYSASTIGDGKFGEYGNFMFDEELITWSVDGGGRLFHRHKHKFSTTNVTGFIRILQPNIIEYKFLYYALTMLHSRISFDWVKKAHPTVLRKEYTDIPLPPLTEQKRIVEKLYTTFAEIDKAIQDKTTRQAETTALKSALLATELDAGEKGKEWKVAKLGEVAGIIAGQSPKGDNYNKEGVGTPFYQGKKDYGDKYLKKPTVWTKTVTKTALEGDILMSMRAPVGSLNIATQKICIGRGLASIRVNEDVSRDYIYYALSNIADGLTGSAGAVFNSISKKQIEDIVIPLPPLPEQKRIVEKLDSAFSEADRMDTLTNQAVQNYTQLKSAILARELNGTAQ